jgi:hypothetical protein
VKDLWTWSAKAFNLEESEVCNCRDRHTPHDDGSKQAVSGTRCFVVNRHCFKGLLISKCVLLMHVLQ